MAPSGESSQHIHEGPIRALQLATHVMYDEEEVPNAKCMCVVEEEVSLSQAETTTVPLEEEEVPVPQVPPVIVLPEEELVQAPLVKVQSEGRGCLVLVDDHGPVPPLVSFSPFFFFLKNVGDSSHPFFS
jgi:hypothetical protein